MARSLTFDDEPAKRINEAVEAPSHNEGPASAQAISDYDVQTDQSIPEAVQRELYYRPAGFWIRLLAFGIDLVIIFCLDALLLNSLWPDHVRTGAAYKILAFNAQFLGIIGFLYLVLTTHYFQQTLGKMVAGIKVIQLSGEPLDWQTVIFREVVARSLSQLLGINLGYIFCWFNQKSAVCMIT
jgi:uncharacterized RDD family membrane protein YckC